LFLLSNYYLILHLSSPLWKCCDWKPGRMAFHEWWNQHHCQGHAETVHQVLQRMAAQHTAGLFWQLWQLCNRCIQNDTFAWVLRRNNDFVWKTLSTMTLSHNNDFVSWTMTLTHGQCLCLMDNVFVSWDNDFASWDKVTTDANCQWTFAKIWGSSFSIPRRFHGPFGKRKKQCLNGCQFVSWDCPATVCRHAVAQRRVVFLRWDDVCDCCAAKNAEIWLQAIEIVIMGPCELFKQWGGCIALFAFGGASRVRRSHLWWLFIIWSSCRAKSWTVQLLWGGGWQHTTKLWQTEFSCSKNPRHSLCFHSHGKLVWRCLSQRPPHTNLQWCVLTFRSCKSWGLKGATYDAETAVRSATEFSRVGVW